MQGVASEGTPVRDLGDTYSVSTDPSEDGGETKGPDPHEADSMAIDATSNQPDQARQHTRGESGAQPSAASQGQLEASFNAAGTQETQYDPAEDAAMQEGELVIG